jgi:hypothetical protein
MISWRRKFVLSTLTIFCIKGNLQINKKLSFLAFILFKFFQEFGKCFAKTLYPIVDHYEADLGQTVQLKSKIFCEFGLASNFFDFALFSGVFCWKFSQNCYIVEGLINVCWISGINKRKFVGFRYIKTKIVDLWQKTVNNCYISIFFTNFAKFNQISI